MDLSIEIVVSSRFPMEMHLVHKSTSGQVAVIALLYTLGLANPFLSQVLIKIHGSLQNRSLLV